MLEMGARFTNDFYVKLSIDPSDGTCTVEVEQSIEGEKHVLTGTVTWDE